MKIPFQLPGHEQGPHFLLERSALTGRVRLFADQQELPRLPKQGMFDKHMRYHVPLPDGQQHVLTLTNRVYDSVPAADFNGQEFALAKKLSVWEYIVAGLPLLLVFGGGAVGGGLGVGAMLLNLGIMRSGRPGWQRVALCLGTALVAFLLLGVVYNLLAG